MSALTDLFTAMANKIRSKTGTATTYTPSEMVSDGIDDVYDAGVASATTPITPSNSSPASMTANTGYKPTANGYAISSYSNVTPSSTQTAVSSGDIVKIGGSGVIVDSVPTPTSLTPSNSSPATITSGGLYQATTNGKAVASISSVTPSNSSPVSVSNGSVYKMSGNGYAIASYNSLTPSNVDPAQLTGNAIYKVASGYSGYAILSYSAKLPSDSNPPSVASGDIVLMGGAGYLVSSLPYIFDTPTYVKQANISGNGTLTQTTSSRAKLVIAFRARYGDNNGQSMCMIWDEVNKRGYLLQYGSSYVNNAVDNTQDTIIVTDTNVTFKNKASSTQRGHMVIWC